MEDINVVMLNGRLTKDSDLSYTKSGYPLCKFDIAVNRRIKQGDSWTERADFFTINLWGKIGESLNQYLVKGQQVSVQGKLNQDRWEDKDGSKRSRIIVSAEKIQLVGGKKESVSQERQEPAKNMADVYNNNYDDYDAGDEERFEDDVPF
jgi:single-strand DNA-binding protein